MQRLHLASLAMAAACGSPGNAGSDATTTTADAPAGSNTITGAIGGTGFNVVMSTYWIGAPDSPSTDTVLYMFDHVVMCGQITNAGWDTGLPTGTQILEMKLVGKAANTYPNTTAATRIPAPGESLSSYTVAAAGATDMVASGGSVTLATIETPSAGNFAIGAFHITFPTGSLDGKFDAPFCAAGREP